MEEMCAWGKVGGRRVQFPGAFPLPQHLQVFTYPEALWTLLFGGFMEASLCRHAQLAHWLLVIDAVTSSSPLSGAESSNLLFKAWSFWGPAPSQSYVGSHQITSLE